MPQSSNGPELMPHGIASPPLQVTWRGIHDPPADRKLRRSREHREISKSSIRPRRALPRTAPTAPPAD